MASWFWRASWIGFLASKRPNVDLPKYTLSCAYTIGRAYITRGPVQLVGALTQLLNNNYESSLTFTDEFGNDDLSVVSDHDLVGAPPDDIADLLSPIQKYAFKFFDVVSPVVDSNELLELDKEVLFVQNEWQLDVLEKIRFEEAKQLEDDDQLLFYEVVH